MWAFCSFQVFFLVSRVCFFFFFFAVSSQHFFFPFSGVSMQLKTILIFLIKVKILVFFGETQAA